MGLGDNLMATGLARGAKARGKRIALGDGRRILWDGHNSEIVFRNNPNLARPGDERAPDIEWLHFFKGSRIYNHDDKVKKRWIWNPKFHAIPGELYLDDAEKVAAKRYGSGFVVIEPHVEQWKSCAPNKDWGFSNYQAVADKLLQAGHEVVQFRYPKAGPGLAGVRQVETTSYRDAVSILGQASLYVGPEGGLHHGAAAMDRQAVVLFGGFIPPSVTGYSIHANLTGGAEACGNYTRCEHCIAAMNKIKVEEVLDAALARL